MITCDDCPNPTNACSNNNMYQIIKQQDDSQIQKQNMQGTQKHNHEELVMILSNHGRSQ